MRQLRVRVCSELWCGVWKSVWRHFQGALCEGPTPGWAWLGSSTEEMINPALVPVAAEGRCAKLPLSPLWVCFGRTEPGMVLGATLNGEGKAELPWESSLSWVAPALLALQAAPPHLPCQPKHTDRIRQGPFRSGWGRSLKHTQLKWVWGHSWKWLPLNFPHSLPLALPTQTALLHCSVVSHLAPQYVFYSSFVLQIKLFICEHSVTFHYSVACLPGRNRCLICGNFKAQ